MEQKRRKEKKGREKSEKGGRQVKGTLSLRPYGNFNKHWEEESERTIAEQLGNKPKP